MVARRLLLILVCGLAVVAAACKPTLPKYNYAGEPDPRTSEWILGVGDQISINVWENAALNTEATIRPDGSITMPLIGDLRAVGETPTSLKAMIKGRLADYVKVSAGTEITVAVRGANSYRFSIVGEVQNPGVQQLGYYVTVVEAIALAGGFTHFAERNRIRILRRDAKTGAMRTIPIAYDFLADGSHPEMNLVIMPGDSVFVP